MKRKPSVADDRIALIVAAVHRLATGRAEPEKASALATYVASRIGRRTRRRLEDGFQPAAIKDTISITLKIVNADRPT